MKITTKFLKSLNACQPGIDLVATYEDKDHEAVIRRLVADNHWDWANWFLPHLMAEMGKMKNKMTSYQMYVSYAAYAAELVLPVWDAEYPNDDRPRKAIEAAKRCIANPSEGNKSAARAAAEAAWAAVDAAVSAARAAQVAETARAVEMARAAQVALAAVSAAEAAWAEIDAAWSATQAATAARLATEAAATEADVNTKPKIIEKGLEILRQKNN